jgi:hypothetical protein
VSHPFRRLYREIGGKLEHFLRAGSISGGFSSDSAIAAQAVSFSIIKVLAARCGLPVDLSEDDQPSKPAFPFEVE